MEPPDEGQLSPRMARVVQQTSAKGGFSAMHMARAAVCMGMLSIAAVTVFWDSPSEFLDDAVKKGIAEPSDMLEALWEAASEESDIVTASLGRIAAVAARYRGSW